MWQQFRTVLAPWNLALPISSRSKSEQTKTAHELFLLNLAGPVLFGAEPRSAEKRESPDFALSFDAQTSYVEIVDAVPDGLTATGAMNLEERRSHRRSDVYQVSTEQFARVLVDAIEGKREKARSWVARDARLDGNLFLVVNAGIAPLDIREYFPTERRLEERLGIRSAAPFVAIAAADRAGAYVWSTPPGGATS